MRQLTLLRDGTKVAAYGLDLADVIIGRGETAHVRLDDNRIVSRQHAVVRERGNGHVVEDLGGANGTFVNGHQIEVHILRPGDRIAFGPDVLRYDLSTGDATSLLAQVQRSQAKAELELFASGRHEEISELSTTNLEEADELAAVREARSSGPPPVVPVDHKEGTLVASRDELEELLARMAVTSGPHLVLHGEEEAIVKLSVSPTTVGWLDSCAVRLPGTRWWGRLAGAFVDQGGWCFVPESPFWSPVKRGDEVLRRLVRLRSGDRLSFAGHVVEFSKGEER